MTDKKFVNIHVEKQFNQICIKLSVAKEKKDAANIVDGPLNILWFSSMIRKTNRMVRIVKTVMQK